jgi:hypothetical protein
MTGRSDGVTYADEKRAPSFRMASELAQSSTLTCESRSV